MGNFIKLIKGDKPVLVDFYAPWCGPCKRMAPILKEAKRMLEDSVTVVRIDVDKNQATVNNFDIKGVPTLVLFANGEIVWKKSGVVPAEKIVHEIQPHLQQVNQPN